MTAEAEAVEWRFAVDVGGTFTDAVARGPDGRLHTAKVLSSASIRGRPGPGSSPARLVDPGRRGEPDGFFRGWEAALLGEDGTELARGAVTGSSGAEGAVDIRPPFASLEGGALYELRSPEEVPLVAVRRILGLRLDEPLPRMEIRLGTTRGTNALLERRGARTAFVTTRGFGDTPHIGYQDRPRLFELAVHKPPPLHEAVLELDERVAADGRVLVPLDEDHLRRGLERLRAAGVESLAVCLLHARRHPAHEETVERIAREAGFAQIAISSRSAPGPAFVPRADTTLVDAYLTPVLSGHVARLAARAPEARLRFLTSAGGLVASGRFRGKDSILSGPAGGVVGVGRVAERHGLASVIGLDMGGTSTDVCRYEGGLPTEHETRKAGVRIAAPLLAIETVAAGGGSVCSFDGERLVVGPESAGARPGPACYGAGGPLTVTDVNLWLGRAPEERFPFPLSRAAVERRLRGVSAELGRAGHARGPDDAAAGFSRVAAARMAAAIRRISIARGHDPRGDALVVFGGAGGQHACAVADELGIGHIIVPRLAGILSAEGAGAADTRAFAERAVLRRARDVSGEELEGLFARLEDEARAEALAEGAPAEALAPPRRTLEARYAGQEATLELALPGDPTELFEREHRRRYGYVHRGREVDLVSARVECVGRTGRDGVSRVTGEAGDATPGGDPAAARLGRRVGIFGGRRREALLLDAEALPPGDGAEGPALLLAPWHTVVVEPGWTARKHPSGDLRIERGGPDAGARPGRRAEGGSQTAAREAPDPVRLEIFHQHFAAVAEEMGIVLRRSAISTNVRERLDYSCAVFDAAGGLVANAPHIPVHLGALGDCVRQVMRDVPGLGAGDAVATNDPFRGGSHLPDVTVVSPVVLPGESRPAFWVASRAHHAEIGGRRPGSMPPDSRCLEDEGVLLRNLRVVERGEPRLDALRRRLVEARWPSRAPDENLADVEAQIAANRAGAARLLRLVASEGAAPVRDYMGHIQAAARRLVEARLERLPQGTRRFEDRLDDGTAIRVELAVSGRRARVDFTGTDPVHPGNLNATPAILASAVLYVFRLLLEEDIPLNSGVLEPVERILPECFLAPRAADDPAACPAVAAGNVETSQRVVDTLLGALGVAAASQGTMNNLLFGNERFGYYETIAGGAGATPDADGADAVHTHMTNTRITDPETLEARYPVRLRRFAVRWGSGGAGRRRGGAGVVRELEFLEEVEVSVVSQRRLRPPWGVEGGEPGAPGRNVFLPAAGAPRELPPIATVRAAPGDALRIETPGGGAWGSPGTGG